MAASARMVMDKWINLKYGPYEKKCSTFPPAERKVSYFSKALKMLFSSDTVVIAQEISPNKLRNK